MTFYTLAAMAFACRFSDRTLTIIALLWIGAVNVLAANPADAAEYSFPGRWILLSSPVQVFPMGLICGIHFERFKQAGRWPYLIGCIVAFACSLPLAELSVVKILFHGFSSCCFILAVADLDIRSRAVKALGNASYGTYLIHFPVMVTAAAISPLHGIFWFFAIGMMGGILFGTLDHYGQMAIATIRRRS
jgi:peptidoglycan/LPS O-acetylase OafA/YrhL